MCKIIEFAGLPGSGKTTLAKEVTNKLVLEGINIEDIDNVRRMRTFKLTGKRRFLKYLSFLFFCMNHLDILFVTLYYAISIKPFNKDSIKFSLVLMNTVFLYKNLKKKNYDLVLIEEGILQNIWAMSIFGRPPSIKLQKILLKKINQKIDFFVIFIEVDENVAIERIINRTGNNGRFDRMNMNNLKYNISSYSPHLKEINELNSQINHRPNLLLQGEDRVNYKVGKIKSYIKNLLMNKNAGLKGE